MIKRYDLSREYRGNIGTPAITEQPEGAYVLYDDYAAVFDELRAEKAGLEAIVAAQAGEIERLRDACQKAIQWLEGWASAEPYLTELRSALAQEQGGSDASNPG